MGIFDVVTDACLAAFKEIAEDRGEVTIRHPGGQPLTVEAVFDENFYAATEGDEFPSTDLVTTVSIRTRDFPDARADDLVVAREKNWIVREPRRDGEGMTVLELQRA